MKLKILLFFMATIFLIRCNDSSDYDLLSLRGSNTLNLGERYYEIAREGSVRQVNIPTGSPSPQATTLPVGQFVSIAEINPRYFVIANYVSLLLLDRMKSTLCVIGPEHINKSNEITIDATSKNSNIKLGIYNPTGVFVDEKGELYVANYKGNNILRGEINPKNCSVKFVASYTSSNTGGPENVFVDSGRDILVSANYDQGTVTAFRVSDGTEVWSSNVGQAHGVSILGDIVYATGLTERKLYKLSLKDGKILASKGALGWDPTNGQFMWPTSIFPLDSEFLVVSDAQTGFISTVSSQTLEAVRFTGGNGPSFDLFNYPYSAVPYSNGVAVVSANRGQILFLDSSVVRVVEDFRLVEDGWPEYAKKSKPFGAEWEGYVAEGGSPLSIGSKSYKLGFGQLHPEKSGPILRVPDTSTLYNFGSYIYFLQGSNLSDELSVFFSSSSTSLIGVVSKPGKPSLILSRLIPVDSWLIDDAIVSWSGEALQLEDIKKDFLLRANDFYHRLEKKTWLTKEDLFQTWNYEEGYKNIAYEKYLQYLDRVFRTYFGREFKLVYDRCSTSHCDIEELQAAARKYYSEAIALPYVNIDEFVLVGMASGVSFQQAENESKSVVFDGCGAGKWYPGHGFRALETKTLDDYYAALDMQSSELCISKSDRRDLSIQSISFGWYDANEVAKSIEVFGSDGSGSAENEQSLGVFRLAPPFQIGGYVFSSIGLENTGNFKSIRIRLLQGGAQNRLLLRSLTVSERQPQRALSSLSELVGDISRRIRYGTGTTRLPNEARRTLSMAAGEFQRAQSAHSGNYALMFVAELGEHANWEVFDLEALDGRLHTVVEVAGAGGIKTYDPTIGITYECGVEELIGGNCSYDAAVRAGMVNPVLSVFEGAGFFYGANIIRTYKDAQELLDLYL